MSRSAGGTYTLPGTAVVSGTTISSSDENSFRTDIAAEMTDSLSRSGKGPMTAPLELANGTVALPALTFDSDPDTGLYRVGAGELGIAADGVKLAGITSTTVTLPKGLTVTQSTTNGNGATVTGNGTGAGVNSTGGSSNADAFVGTGGATNGRGGFFTGTGSGDGVRGVGGSSNGTGVIATGGATNGKGCVCTGTGSGNALEATTAAGTGYGAYLTGNATRAPVILAPSAAPSAIDNGALYVNSSTGKLYVGFGGVWVLVGTQS